MSTRGAILIGFCLVLGSASPARAQLVATPFVSATMKTDPGFIDLDDEASSAHGGFGITLSLLRGWFGIEADTSFTPSAFGGGGLVESSRLWTVTGGVLAIAPTPWQSVRPYASFGLGMAQTNSVDIGRIFVIDSSRAVATAWVGTWVWISPRIGIRGGIRFVRSLHTVESGPLETWQPAAGISVKF